MADEQTTGTTPPVDGDAAVDTPTTGTTDGADRDADAEPDYKQMYLDAKSKVERVNDLEEENRRLKETSSQTPAASEVHGDDIDSAEEARIRSFADQGDPIAKRELKRIERERAEAEQQRTWARQLQKIPDLTRRQEVYNEFMKGGYADPVEARAALVERENSELRKQVSANGKRAETTSGVPTGSREGPAPPATKTETMSRAEWETKMDTLDEDDRRALQRARIAGKVKVS